MCVCVCVCVKKLEILPKNCLLGHSRPFNAIFAKPPFYLSSEFKPPWYDSEVFALDRKKDCLHNLSKKSGSDLHQQQFSACRLELDSLIKDKMNSNFEDSSNWNLTKKLILMLNQNLSLNVSLSWLATITN